MTVQQDTEHQVAVLAAAVEVLDLLAKQARRGARPDCAICAYSPDVIGWFLRHWPELDAAANGMGSANSGNPVTLVQSEDPDSRKKIVTTKADIEQATDQALAPMLRWQTVARIYKRQSRLNRYVDLRMRAPRPINPPPEPTMPPLAEAICVTAISRYLGWYEHDVCEAAS